MRYKVVQSYLSFVMKVRPDCVKKYVLDSRKVTSMVKRLQSLHLLQVGPRQPVRAGQVSALLLIKVTEAQHIEQGKRGRRSKEKEEEDEKEILTR